MNGILVINKPKGWTSHDVVAKVRRILKMKKVGHTGTLDPDATGVLPVLLGKATKVSQFMTEHDKEYVAEMVLGVTTDTQDHTGTVLQVRPVNVNKDDLFDILPRFLGQQKQIPPMYSAVKQDGQKLYQLARKGITVERKERPVQIHHIDVLEFNAPDRIKIKIGCSKGTYVRTLIYDIGETLGCGAHMSGLERISSGPFSLQEAITLEDLQIYKDTGRLTECVKPLDAIFDDLEKVTVSKNAWKLLVNGAMIPCTYIEGPFEAQTGKKALVYGPCGQLAGIYYVYSAQEDQCFLKLSKFLLDTQPEGGQERNKQRSEQ